MKKSDHTLNQNPLRYSRKLHAAIGKLLLREWDPMGVRDEPNAQDEYDTYVPELLGLLMNGADQESLAERLRHIATERMGLGSLPARTHQFAAEQIVRVCLRNQARTPVPPRGHSVGR